MSGEIRGEYWINDGRIDSADGDIGDQNHATVAINHVFHTFVDGIASLAKQLKMKGYEFEKYGETNQEECTRAIEDAIELLTKKKKKPINHTQAYAYIMQQLNCNSDVLSIIIGGGNAVKYCIVHERWIAVRNHNVELYGWNRESKESLASGIGQILWDEGEQDVNPEEIEVNITDHATRKSFYMTLAQLEEPEQIARPDQDAMGTYYMGHKDTEENKYSRPYSRPNPWTAAAKKANIIGPGQDLWRGTSETFSQWIKNDESFAHAGNLLAHISDVDEEIIKVLDGYVEKVDKWVGASKFAKVWPKNIQAIMMLLNTSIEFVHNPINNYNKLRELIFWARENITLPLMTGLPQFTAGAMMGNKIMPGGEGAWLGGVVGKIVYYVYYYLGVWADNKVNSNNPKLKLIADNLHKIMPKTLTHK